MLCTGFLLLLFLMHRQEAAGQCLYFFRVLGRIWGSGSEMLPSEKPAADFPLALLGSLTAAAAAGAVSSCRSLPALLLTVLPLGLCIASPGAVPGRLPLFALLTVLSLLLLTWELRRESRDQANRLLLAGLMPLSLMLGLILLAAPEKSYVNHAPRLRAGLTRMAERGLSRLGSFVLPDGIAGLLLPETDPAGRPGSPPPAVPVLEVVSDHSGLLYLRGRDYDRYTGQGWSSTADRREPFGGTGEKLGTITVRTLSVSPMLLLPYYPGEEAVLREGMAENTERLLQYTADCYAPAPLPDPGEEYRNLPPRTFIRAGEMLEQISGSLADTAAAVKTIGDFVRSRAEYDLSPGAMPERETDLAMWFLEDSRRGCCVHFATAAAVLLRSVGIPARYVTGYMTETEAGKPVTVTTDNAHAWVEYYDADAGVWRILEATPAARTGMPEPSEPPAAAEMPKEAAQEGTEAPASDRSVQAQPGTGPTAAVRYLPAALAAGVILLLLRSRLAVLMRYFRRCRGSVNHRALVLWQECCRLSGALSESPPEALRELAEKARFSRSGLKEQELKPFFAYCQQARQRIAGQSRPRRFIRKWIQGIL